MILLPCVACFFVGGAGWALGAGLGREKISRIRENRMREMKRVYEARAENIAKGHGQVCVPLPLRATVLGGWVIIGLH